MALQIWYSGNMHVCFTAIRSCKRGQPLCAFRVRSRIFRWYGQLRDIENRIDSTGSNAALLEELNSLESRAEKVSVPLSYTDELYALRSNIHLVRKKFRGL